MKRSDAIELDATNVVRRLNCEELEYKYCRGVDRRDWNLVRSCYHPDAVDNHGAYNGGIDGLIDWLKERHQSITRSLHYVTNILLDEVDTNTVVVEAYNMTFQRFSSGIVSSDMLEVASDERISGNEVVETEVRCRFIDRCEKRLDDWRIASRVVVYESFSTRYVSERERFPNEAATGKRDATDVLYLSGIGRTS